MNDSRKKMLERVRAILSKTMHNGCTEGEAMAALQKARELMATYDISESELDRTADQETATIHKYEKADPHGVRKGLSMSVARFTRCQGWVGTNVGYGTAFCGLESDVIFATWLLDTLREFVLRELKNHQAQRRDQGLCNPRIISASFVLGCVSRIAERLRELTPMDPIVVGNGTALVLSRNALIARAMANAGISLRQPRARSRYVDSDAMNAGSASGGNARFDRPVGSGGTLLLR